jgi:hypothetical protein
MLKLDSGKKICCMITSSNLAQSLYETVLAAGYNTIIYHGVDTAVDDDGTTMYQKK